METSYILNKKLSVQLADNVVQNRKQKVTIPKGMLEIEKFYYSNPTFFARSIGDDGNIYGAQDGAIARSTDELETVETGYQFNIEGYTLVFSTKTPKGYVAALENRTDGDGTGKVFFSESFTDGFTEVLHMANGRPADLSRSYYHKFDPYLVSVSGQDYLPRYNGIVLFGEYTTQTTAKESKVYASFDGGQNFEAIYTAGVIDPTLNNHIHACVYDPYRGRIWVATGDGGNARIVCSDNLGETWVDVNLFTRDDNFPINEIITQPTFIIPLRDKIILTPDGSQVPAIASIKLDNKYVKTGTEAYEMSWDFSVRGDIHAGTGYGRPPYVVDGDVVYTTFSYNSKSFVVASGDGGNSWHYVMTLNHKHVGGAGLAHGLIGLSKEGYMFAYYQRGTRTILAKIKPIEWEML